MKKKLKKMLSSYVLLSLLVPALSVNAEEAGTEIQEPYIMHETINHEIDEFISEDTSEEIAVQDSAAEEEEREFVPILFEEEVDYAAIVVEPAPVATEPWETEGFEEILEDEDFTDEMVDVSKEAATEEGLYAFISIDNEEIGWIDHSALAIVEEADEDVRKNASGKVMPFSQSRQAKNSYHEVLSSANTSYSAIIVKPWSINTRPWGTEGAETIASGRSYLGETVHVVQEKVTERNTYALIESKGEQLGWIDTTGLEPHTVLSTTNVQYTAVVTKPWSINTEPWGVNGYKTVQAKNTLVGESVNVVQEKETNRGTYVLLERNSERIGWIDSTGIQKNDEVLAVKDTSYAADIVQPWSINTRPWGLEGYKPVAKNGTYLGETVEVLQEKVTDRGTFGLIKHKSNVLGWIDKGALNVHEVLSSDKASYKAIVTQPWSINTLPWGIEGYQTVASASAYVGKTVDVIEETTTPRSTYALIERNGEPIGWLDKDGLEVHEVLSTTDVQYTVKVTKPWSVNTEPWGTKGAEPVQLDRSLVGEVFNVTQEKTTNRSTYVLLERNNEKIGWIDSTGVEKSDEVFSINITNYKAVVTHPWSINTRPWGTNGFETIGFADAYVGETVTVLQEKVTERSTFALIQTNKETLGWIDKTGLEEHKVLSTEDTAYVAKVTKPWSITTQPWGTNGYETVTSASSYIGEEVNVVQEKTTQRSTYALIEQKGDQLGWIDTTGLEPLQVSSTKDVQYTVEVTRPWSVNTQPWGTKGYQLVQSGSSLVGKVFNVLQEQVTQRGTYVLLEKDGSPLGWIDSTGVKKSNEILSIKNVRYAADVTKPWSINTQPWGTTGFKTIGFADDYVSETVHVVQEQVTERSTYALIEFKGKQLGWIDTTGLRAHRVSSTRTVSYSAVITQPWSINSQPWGVEGYEPVVKNGTHLGKKVDVLQEKTTHRSTYALIALNGAPLGWIDKNALGLNRVVFIDPGHGGSDSGAVGRLNGRNIYEKDLNLSVSLKVRDLLEKEGYEVIMSRETDKSLSLLDRSRMSNNSNADLFLSIHFNAFGTSTVHGIETLYYRSSPSYPPAINQKMHNDPERLEKSVELAYILQDSLISATGAHYRRVAGGSYAVLRETVLPASLVELGFMTNQMELSKAVTPAYQDILARGLLDGINNYYNTIN